MRWSMLLHRTDLLVNFNTVIPTSPYLKLVSLSAPTLKYFLTYIGLPFIYTYIYVYIGRTNTERIATCTKIAFL